MQLSGCATELFAAMNVLNKAGCDTARGLHIMRVSAWQQDETENMNKLFNGIDPARFLACARRLFNRRAGLALALAAFALAPSLGRISADAARRDKLKTEKRAARLPGGQFDCGYDPRGAEDELSKHRLNALRLNKRVAALMTTASLSAPKVEDIGGTSIIEDDGTIILPPSKFDLNNNAVIFTPDGNGFRVAPADIAFNRNYGFRLGFFFGADGELGNYDNGYHDIDIAVRGPLFPFYGAQYDTLYIGTNGYITFGRGDTNGRASPAALATGLPRIAPLWTDLSVSEAGNIYYTRLSDRHIVTWDKVPDAVYGGKNTFQAVLYDDGRIAFVYKKIKAHSAVAGISPGNSDADAQPVDLSEPTEQTISGPFFEAFSKEKLLDVPALMRAFYSAHDDAFDFAYIWADFDYDNGLGVAHSFNVRNNIQGIGLRIFDRGSVYGSPARLATIITMGNQRSWPADPQTVTAGLFTALAIMCHELGHRWLAYVLFDAEHDIKDDLLGRDFSHWSFLADTRANSEGSFSSLMEGNAWRDNKNGSFTTIETSANFFSPLDQYLMGLRAADEVGEIKYLATDPQAKQILHDKSPLSGFSLNAIAKTANVSQIAARCGQRVPDAASAPKEFRVAFILVTEQGARASNATLEKIENYRDSLVRYFRVATDRRASLDASLNK